jgi:hypothetical protein
MLLYLLGYVPGEHNVTHRYQAERLMSLREPQAGFPEGDDIRENPAAGGLLQAGDGAARKPGGQQQGQQYQP